MHDIKKEIISSVNKKTDEVKKEVINLKKILIYGFQSIFALMKNDHYTFEEKNKQFQKSIEISNKSKKTFEIEEKAQIKNNKLAFSSKI